MPGTCSQTACCLMRNRDGEQDKLRAANCKAGRTVLLRSAHVSCSQPVSQPDTKPRDCGNPEGTPRGAEALAFPSGFVLLFWAAKGLRTHRTRRHAAASRTLPLPPTTPPPPGPPDRVPPATAAATAASIRSCNGLSAADHRMITEDQRPAWTRCTSVRRGPGRVVHVKSRCAKVR